MNKKITALCIALFSATVSFGQFFVQTTYRGAFGPEGTYDWTKGWTEFDPEFATYPSTNKTVSTDITSNTTWSTGDVVLLQNKIYVKNGATLTIEPGVIIRGDKATEGTLIITKGSKIMASGTPGKPIVFTSNLSEGSRAPGDWGGIIVLGNAVNNQGTAVVEGGLDATDAAYGGSNDADNSGVLQYIRIEFAGIAFQPDKEINSLTLGSVGSGTTIDHIQCSFGGDDSFEWFGGTVNLKYIISYRTVDDDFDSDFGFSGKIQFGLIVRDPDLADQCTCSTSEGFESDNDGSGTAATPQTSAVFSNITLIGPYRGSTSNSIDSKFKRALRIRKNSGISVFNSVFTDFPTGLHIDGTASETNAQAVNGLVFANNTLAGMGSGKNLQVNSGSTFGIAAYFAANNNDSVASSTSLMFVNAYPDLDVAPSYMLKSGSPLLTGASFSNTTKFGTVVACALDITAPTVVSDTNNAGLGSITASVASANGTITYVWNHSASATSSSATGLTAGSYTVYAIDALGCVDSVQATVGNVTGINDESISQFNINPNPVIDVLNIKFNSTSNTAFVKVVSITGQIVYSEVMNSNGSFKKSIDMTNLRSGVYFVQILSDNSIITKKVVRN